MTISEMNYGFAAFAGLGLFLLCLILAAFRSSRADVKRLLDHGASAEAEIQGYIGRTREDQKVRYRFVAAGRTEPTECVKQIGKFDKRFPTGTKVSVRYNPKWPNISVLEPYVRSQDPTS